MSEEAVVDYHPMWEELGLDLPTHDALLGAVGQMYGDAFLTQENRPEGMGYLDFVMSEVHGLRVKELHDFRATGGKVVGTFCLYVPEEIIRAAGAWCVGLCAGAEFGYDEVERIMPRNTCALIKCVHGLQAHERLPVHPGGGPRRRRDHLRRQEEGVRAARRDAQRVRHGAPADEAPAGHRVLPRRARRVPHQGRGAHRQDAHRRDAQGRPSRRSTTSAARCSASPPRAPRRPRRSAARTRCSPRRSPSTTTCRASRR